MSIRSSWVILLFRSHIFTDLLSTWFINYWQSVVEVFQCKSGFIYFSCSFRFCLKYFDAMLLGWYTFRVVNVFLENWPLSHCIMPYFSWIIFQKLRSNVICHLDTTSPTHAAPSHKVILAKQPLPWGPGTIPDYP